MLYNIITDITSANVDIDRLDSEIASSSISSVLTRIEVTGSDLDIIFGSTLSAGDELILDAIVLAHSGEELVDQADSLQKVHVSDQPAFANNVLEDGSLLYLKIHGMMAVIPASSSHEFLFTIPYTFAYMQGAEIFSDILAQTDMTIKHPTYGVLEQYGYDVCTGRIIYEREAKYAAKLPQGIQVSLVVTNKEAIEQEMGVNFILHEIREDV